MALRSGPRREGCGGWSWGCWRESEAKVHSWSEEAGIEEPGVGGALGCQQGLVSSERGSAEWA